TAKLIKAAGDRHLWSETYNRELDDVFTIQEEISTAIVDNLRIRLLGKEKESLAKPYTKNIEAYEAYIKGRYYYLSFTNEGRKKALQYYEEAVRLDPCYALAYSAIAEYYWGTPSKGPRTISRDEAYTRAMEAINTALEIDNSIPEAYATLGIIKMHYEWDIKGAEKAYKTAVDLNPGLSKVHYDYAFYLAITGDINNAFLEARKSIELDPLFGLTHMCYGICLLVSGQYDQALEKLLQGHEMMPTYVDAFTCLASVYILKGMFDEAMDEIIKGLEIAPGEHILLSQLGHINSLKGKKEKTQEILNELLEISKKEFVNPVAVASLYIDLEETDKAFEWLEKSCETREISFYFLMAGQLRFLYLDPRVNPFFKKLGV
ncbi:MAG: hypothetical protein JW927_14505, partial [Deltaproteobacteria bacterium]|nr:hypothetical protein [Deltaproteobacteria bacterium]